MQNIKSFASEHTAIFLIFLICEFLSMTAILFVFHYYMGLNTEDEQYDTVHRQFTIQEDMTKNEADNYIHQILQDKKNELRSVYILLADHPVKANYLYYSLNGRFTNIGQYFTPEDFVSPPINQPIVIGRRPETMNLNVGDIYNFGGYSYTVRGITVPDALHEVLPSSLQSTEKVASIVVELKDIPSFSKAQHWKKYLENLSQEATISSPKLLDFSILSDRVFEILSTTCILLLSFFNLSSLYVFILDRRRPTYAIWRMIGCSQRRGIILLMGEVFLLITIPFLISAIFYHIIFSPFVQKTNILIHSPLSITYYMQAYLLIFLVCAVVFIPRILRFSHSPITIFKQER